MTDSFVHDPVRQEKVEKFQTASRQFYALALRVDELAALFDESAEACSCCSTVRYRNWPQRQFRARVSGASERLRELGETLARRANETEFLDGQKGGQP